MARIIVTEFVSLDNVFEDPGGSEGFEYGGWTFDFPGEDRYAFKFEETNETDALLLGRVTYEGFAAAWPSREGEFADKFNSMPKYVVSSTLKNPEWTNTTVLEGDPLDAVRRLKGEQDGTIAVHGSGMLAQALLEHDLVDQLNLMVYPVVVGKGRRLFGETSAKKPFELAESRTYDENVLVLIYRPAAG
jgi:dihydrofolate reductase